MAFTYDVTTDRGKTRLLAVDTKSTDYIFDDDEIDTFLALQSNSVYRAAALALDTIASNEALVLKRVTSLDLSTDGPATAKALRESADQLRQQAKEAEAREDDGAFDFAEMVVDPFTRRERWWKQRNRDYSG